MPDETVHGYPFPLADEPFAVGNENIQALAEFADHWATMTTADSMPNGLSYITFDSFLGSSHFALGTMANPNDCLEYSGPARYFTWWAEIRWPAQISGTRNHTVQVTPGPFNALQETVDLASPSNTYFYRSGIIPLTPGDRFTCFASQSTGSPVSMETRWILAAL